MNTRAQRLCGFTLIELLVVISIVAILSAMSLSGLSAVKQAANQVKCSNNQRQLAQMVMMYSADYDSMLPNWVGAGIVGIWFQKLINGDYLANQEVYVPLGTNMGSGSGRVTCCPSTGKQPALTQGGLLELPVTTPGFFTPSSYGTANRVLGLATRERSVASVGATSLAPLFADALMRPTWPYEGYSNFIDYGPTFWPIQLCGLLGFSPRHRGRVVHSFLDGHVDSFKWEASAYSDDEWLKMYRLP